MRPFAPWSRHTLACLLLCCCLAGAPLMGQGGPGAPQVLRLERRAPDYRFRLHAEYRAPGQKPMALSLRGGSAKGLAHLGVLQGFDQENLPIDAIVGTSAGSIMGSLYASGFSANGIARIFKSRDFGSALDDRAREAGWSLSEDETQHASPFGLAFRQGRLDLMPGGNRSKRYREGLMPLLARASWLAGGDFDRLRMPLRVVTSDLTAGRGQVFARGSLVDVVMASSCLPGIFEPVVIDGHQYVDGGPFENLPLMTARQAFPAMVQVGVAIGRPWDPLPKTNLASLLNASLDLSMAQTERRREAEANLILRPEVAAADEFDFLRQVDALVMAGRQTFNQNRESLEDLVYGPESRQVVARGLELEAGSGPEAASWLVSFGLTEGLSRRDLYRLLRRAHRDLAISGAEIRLPAGPSGLAQLVLQGAAPVARLELDLPADWPTAARLELQEALRKSYGIEAGRPFHEGAWSQALESLLIEALLRELPILDLRGSGFSADGTLLLRAREPRVHSIRSSDPRLQGPLARYLAPLQAGALRTSDLDESLALASTRFGISRLRPDLRQEGGNLVLFLDPVQSPSLTFSPHLAYESTWGGHLGLDVTAPNVMGLGSPLQAHFAVNNLQSLLQGQMIWVPSALPSLGIGVFGSLHKQWFPEAATYTGDKFSRSEAGLRTQVRYGWEHRGLLQVDLGHTEDWSTLKGLVVDSSRTSQVRAATEWDSLDSHTLPTRGLLVRATWVKTLQAELGPKYATQYLRVRQLWNPADSRFGLSADAEVGIQQDAPMSRWFLVGGPASLMGTHSASYLVPNFGILRLGFPFTLTTLFGVAIQGVPRLDTAWLPLDYQHPNQGLRATGYGLVLRGVLKSLYVELAVGRVHVRAPGIGETSDQRHLSFLIGTQPFDLWKGR